MHLLAKTKVPIYKNDFYKLIVFKWFLKKINSVNLTISYYVKHVL